MPESNLTKSRICQNMAVLACGLFLALLLATVDGDSLGPLKKFTAMEYVEPQNIPLLEAEGYDPVPKKYIVMTGSCQLQSYMATATRIDPHSSIPAQVEADLHDKGMTNVRVLNLSIGGRVTGRNLRIFLRFLEDPRFRVFVWHNDLNVDDIADNRMRVDHFMFRKLMMLRKKFPNIREINEILISKFKSPTLEEETLSDVSDSRDVLTTLVPDESESRSYLPSFLKPIASFIRQDVNLQIERNTYYLREWQRRLPEYFHFPLARVTPEYGGIGWRGYRRTYYRDTRDIHDISGADLEHDDIATLRLMGQLAKIYHKQIYVYFGPEGRPDNEQNDVYTLKFKMPIVNAVSGLSTIHVIDLTKLELVEKWDLLSQVNLSYLGSRKAAKEIAETIYINESTFLQ